MIGAILGDVVGSRFEFRNRLSKEFAFLHPDCEFTDDTVMTITVAEALLRVDKNASDDTVRQEVISCMQSWGRKYPDAGYGGRFYGNEQPYTGADNGTRVQGLERCKQSGRQETRVHQHDAAGRRNRSNG